MSASNGLAASSHPSKPSLMQLQIEAAVKKHLDGDDAAAQQAYESLLNLGCKEPLVYTNLASIYIQVKEYESAIKLLREVLEIYPKQADAYLKLGCCLELYTENGLNEAIECYQKVLELDPKNSQVNFVLGNALVKKNDADAAITCFEHVLEHKTGSPEVAHFNLGNLFMGKNQYDKAEKHFKAALELDPNQIGALSKYWHLRMKMCKWEGHDELIDQIHTAIDKLDASSDVDVTSAISPFSLINLIDDGETFLKLAHAYDHATTREMGDVSSFIKQARTRLEEEWENNPQRSIKLAFLSADFYNHATAYLMGELFELIDKDRFDIHIFSFGKPDPNSVMRLRIERQVKYFHEVGEQNDMEIAMMIAALGIDIAIDLKGYTAHCRPAILAHQPAPVQVNYLGYPGTMGADHIDYLIADPFIIPEDHQKYYSEKIAYLPDSYQINDSKRVVDENRPTRTECGLPEDAFVFCCFNQSYKFSPELFDVWMELLKETPNSVLWLYESNEWATENLRSEAKKRGVSPERIIFAPNRSVDQHLSRAQNADLFLDNFPCNAHTTASDALWIGLPLITLSGNSFASRVAGGLLHAIGVDELITDNIEDYKNLALQLANNPTFYQEIRNKLVNNRDKTALFDTKKYVDHFQHLLEIMQDKKLNELTAEHIVLSDKHTEFRRTENKTMEQPIQTEEQQTSDNTQPVLSVNITIIRPTYNKNLSDFDDTAKVLQHALSDLGFNTDLTFNTVLEDSINIILGAHFLNEADLEHVPETSIIYNLEKISNSTFVMQPSLLEMFKRFPVWDFSRQNISELNKQGIQAIHVPLGYHACQEQIKKPKLQDIDVLFYGYANSQQQKILEELEANGLKVESLKDIQQQEHSDYIARSKVILNMASEDSAFELIQLPYLLANKKAVVSEDIKHTELQDDIKQAIKIVSNDQIVNTCIELVKSDDARLSFENKGFNVLQHHLAIDYLNNAFADLAKSSQEVEVSSSVTDQDAETTNIIQKDDQHITTPLPNTLNFGSGRDYNPVCLNIDISGHHKTDAITDLTAQDLIGKTVMSTKYGVINFSKNQFDKILASNVLTQVSDLTGAMTNCLDLLTADGELQINVPYDLSYGAWQDPATLRTFNERSWLHYTDWFWSMNWTEARFELTNIDFQLSPIGMKMKEEGVDVETILAQPRAVDSMQVLLTKRLLTEKEKIIGLTGVVPQV